MLFNWLLQFELTLNARLRYSLGGDRPSQTTLYTLFCTIIRLAIKHYKSGISLEFKLFTDVKALEQLPTYTRQVKILPQYINIVKVPGSFRLAANTLHLHREFNFTGLVLETVGQSLRHSCRTSIKCQGISLP